MKLKKLIELRISSVSDIGGFMYRSTKIPVPAREYVFFWKDGTFSILKGCDPIEACQRSGLSQRKLKYDLDSFERLGVSARLVPLRGVRL